MRSFLLTSLMVITLSITSFAGEGMWLPLLLGQLNESEMQAMGMKMTAEDIYSVNQGSLKDAIVHFGGFCTGEVISSQGLLLTNHHCGFGQIQSHSSLENNYLEDGFWAMTKEQELPNPGLYVTFIVRIEDVTERVNSVLKPEMAPKERQSATDKILEDIKSSLTKEEYQDVSIRPFFNGNQYFAFITETYNDVRLVGTPPSSIGKFGADTDNWEWPRHTGDFSMFRIYAGPDGKPAEYSEDNVPMKPRHYLPVSMDGVEEGDFTLIFGFPGRTNEYLPAVAMDQMVNKLSPVRIRLRDRSLAILDQAMRDNPEARIQYAAKQASIANGWKKWKGERLGIEATDAIEKRLQMEQDFIAAIKADEDLHEAHKNLLPEFDYLYNKIEPLAISRDYVIEIVYRNVELFRLTTTLKRYLNIYKNNGIDALEERLPGLQSYLEEFYKNYNPKIDQKIGKVMMEVYHKSVVPIHQAPYAKDQLEFASGDVELLMNKIFGNSFLTKGDFMLEILSEYPAKFFEQLEGDYAYQYINELLSFSEETIFNPYNEVNEQIQDAQRRYMAALMEVFPDRRFYPDANSTMRVTYGQVDGYSVSEDETYEFATDLDGVIEKYVPGDYEFDVPAKLRKLYEDKDFGEYTNDEGRVPVCFLGSNHTTGGNSGSPAIDAHGNLIGLNFDRTWHGTMSDINYDPEICRNIMVDVKYILFIVDKFAGAGHLVEEMTLVHPKQ
ncbi:S46 family peptidase [Lewinella cohaerens]|uniref:S46 family peptidase n=1 Tax=Lewinella cohaerens TaxID=70995 RepID=UPI00036A5454|nr:S46 family peptidase [Lewinella cohaerens]